MKYLILQNTIAPYRISLFNKLYAMGMDIEVLYMCELENGRSWKINYDEMKYPYYVDKGFNKMIHGFEFNWNPKILKRFRKDKNVKIIMGSPWNYPDVLASCILKRLGLIKSEIIFWSEANYLTIGSRKKNRFRDWLRSFVYNTGEGHVIISGHMGEVTFEKWNLPGKKFHFLPNVIEEERFEKYRTMDKSYTPNDEQPHFVMCLRLIEYIKGIINFFTAIGLENVKRAQFYLIGDGPDEQMVREFVKDNGYEDNIHLLGFCNMDQIARQYSKCDAMILPSFTDASPLVLVEAIYSKLPLLISTRCGNHFETLAEGINGFGFDPDNHKEIKRAFESLMNKRSEWPEMGRESRKLFEKNFEQDTVLRNFINSF